MEPARAHVNDPYDPYKMPAIDEHGIPYVLAFNSDAEYEAWRERYPQYVATYVDVPPTDAERERERQMETWRAAGRPGLPPGTMRARDYFRERFGLDV
jgi:hypothetical protein